MNIKRSHIVGGVLIFIILLVVIVSSSSNTTPSNEEVVPQSVVTQEEVAPNITAIESELSAWAEGRWQDFQIGTNEGGILIRIYADSLANEVALNSYCDVVKETVQEHSPSHLDQTTAYVYQGSEISKTCVY